EVARKWIESHPKTIAKAEGKGLLKICPDFSSDTLTKLKERIILWDRTIVIESQHYARQVGIIRLRATKLIIIDCWSRTVRSRSARKILKLSASADITDENEEFTAKS